MAAGDMINAGAVQEWTTVFRSAGGGARGVAAGDRYLANHYPDESSQSRRVIGDVARDALAAGRRYNTAGPDYQLPADAYADLSSYQRRVGTGGDTLYGHRVQYSFDIVRPGGRIHTRTRTTIVSSDERLTHAEVLERAELNARAQIAADLLASPTSRRGAPGAPGDLGIISAYRYVG